VVLLVLAVIRDHKDKVVSLDIHLLLVSLAIQVIAVLVVKAASLVIQAIAVLVANPVSVDIQVHLVFLDILVLKVEVALAAILVNRAQVDLVDIVEFQDLVDIVELQDFQVIHLHLVSAVTVEYPALVVILELVDTVVRVASPALAATPESEQADSLDILA
jgi:hypothetical protein